MLKLEISAVTATELKAATLDLLNLFNSETDEHRSNLSEKPETLSETPKEPVKRSRKGKAAAAEAKNLVETPVSETDSLSDPFGISNDSVTEVPSDDMFGDEPASEKKFTSDDLRTALKNYHDKRGPEKTKKLLAKFNYARPADVKEADFEKVIAACN